ncbi:GGDEF domain-containing protein [Pseudodesulfovibrio sp.]|uniref:GGDEF domain-containing protein n=1 Tax=Pseudodesulfovibrio sp. TaxID=2035812 RepID=UPI002611B662|nr:GGDEF domain-containing protein [Pseudodesulfovibrio sp.]MDD3310539.1 GGDEF domain-containing protein [Pseudodesulfovibrio sp.]
MASTRKKDVGLCFPDILKRFGIGDDPDWLAVVLFVRNLLRHLTVYSDEKKREIQQEVFRELARKDFSHERFDAVVAMLDMYLMQTIGALELEESLALERRSAVALLKEMDAVIDSIRGNSERQTRKLDDFRDRTVGVIESSEERSAIVSRVRDMFQELIQEFREEARELNDRARMLERTANFDPLLTGLHNRRALDAYLQETVSAQTDDSLPLSLIMFDVDHFKRVNDTHGHQVGDDVLRVLAGIVSANAIQYRGFAARYGGEELVVILKNIPQNIALLCAESIRCEVERYDFRPRNDGQLSETPVRFTVSAGVAQWQPGWDAGKLVSTADAALYRAKNSGRNNVAAHGVGDK